MTHLINKIKIKIALRVNALRYRITKYQLSKLVHDAACLPKDKRLHAITKLMFKASKTKNTDEQELQYGIIDMIARGGDLVDSAREVNPSANLSRIEIERAVKHPQDAKTTRFVMMRLEMKVQNSIILTEHGRVAFVYHDLDSYHKPRFVAHIYGDAHTIEDGEDLDIQISELEATKPFVRAFPPKIKSINKGMIRTVLSLMHKDSHLFQFVDEIEINSSENL